MKQVTKYFIWSAVIIIVGFDVMARVLGGEDATVSSELLKTAQEYPWLVLAWGVLSGHLFWPQKAGD